MKREAIKRIVESDTQGILEDDGKGIPEYGKQYALTGAPGEKCIANGDTWTESEVNKGLREE